ncbi:MAG TPA: hypothetical protein VGO41_01785 [Steroidobacteraceae bacterium]|jgi:hypothetical protein|nr:hypothetical protein [Steroidobacteraceae bacterium]
MKEPATPARNIAFALMRLATWLLPEERREWARGMQAELNHVTSDREAFAWAFGCVLAGTRERTGSAWRRLARHVQINRRFEVHSKIAGVSVAVALVFCVGMAGIFYLQLPEYKKVRLSIWMDQKLSHSQQN